MQQLKVYPDSSLNPLEAVFIDLYEQDPIKLTFSVEDITNAEASSVFSKTFRVPATSNNNGFFKHAFLIDGVDYDVTVKKPAEILIDGVEFRIGHIRLQKIYINGIQDKIEYEILFLGETKDFSSKIGDRAMCQLEIPELVHDLTTANVINSWQAFPQGGPTSGLFDGDVLYPLIDFGNTYDAGVAQQARISLVGSNRFTQNSHPLTASRFKPMIRAKKLVDKIFQNAGYTYESTFLDSDLFKRMYVSAFGNEAQVELPVNSASENNFSVSDNTFSPFIDPIGFSTENSDLGNNFNISTGVFTVPITGNYTFQAEVETTAQREISFPGGVQYEYVDAQLVLISNGLNVVAQSGFQFTPSNLILNTTVFLNAGEQITLHVDPFTTPDEAYVWERSWQCVSSPGLFNPVGSLDCEYKQIDFIKDILTMFRLVMSPDPFNPNKFIIEPFEDYVYTGETYDWSDKLVRDKDLEIEPLFNTQSDRIEFRFSPDGDNLNDYHQKAYQEPYGYLGFDSDNDLLKGTRKIDVQLAPTPITRIEGAPVDSTFIIPQLTVLEAGDTGTQHLPIKPKTRILFYNGLVPITGHVWYMENAGSFNNYPQVSPYQTFPQTSTGLNLNWYNDIKYWGTDVPGYGQDGITLFQRYWSNYITGLYNKFARRVTGQFILNNVDLQNFSFNDIVFVDGVYYRPEKIIDAPIGQMAPVKVQLIKAIDYRPTQFDQPMIFSLQTQGVSCFGANDGSVTITVQNGLPPYQYQFNGQSGFFTQYQFTLDNIAAGDYQLTIAEAAGFSATQGFGIGEPAELTATHVATPESPCGAANGGIDVNATGGTAPLSIAWSDGSTDFNRTGLSAGTYNYVVISAGGQTPLVDGYNNEVRPIDPDNPGSASDPLRFPDLVLNVDNLWRPQFPNNFFRPTDFGPFRFELTGSVQAQPGNYDPNKFFAKPFKLQLGISGAQPQLPPTTVIGWPPTDQTGISQKYQFTLIWEGVVPIALTEFEVIITPDDPSQLENIFELTNSRIQVSRQECTYSDTVVLPCNAANLTVLVSAIDPETCESNDGQIELTISGGVEPYYVDWADLPGTNDPVIRTGLGVGTYTYTVTDSDQPANVVGPNDVTLSCLEPSASPYTLAFNSSTPTGACTNFTNGLTNTYWSPTPPPLSTGDFLYFTQTGAQSQNPADYVTNGWYSNGSVAYQVISGQITAIEQCSQQQQVWSHTISDNVMDGCAAPLVQQAWSPCLSLSGGCQLYVNELAAQTGDPEGYLSAGTYGAFINGQKVEFDVGFFGTIGVISICDNQP